MAPPNLDTLPPEILFNILSYTNPHSTALLPYHPLLTTAATSKHLCGIVEEYCRSLLKLHAYITPPKAPKTGAFVCRRKWMKWLTTTCAVCLKRSKRRAILDPGMVCCRRCDEVTFPKMTQTHAIRIHCLSKLDLFTPNVLHPTLPPLSIGATVCTGGDTLMISEASVAERKAYVGKLLAENRGGSLSRRRVTLHGRIILHMDVTHVMVEKCRGRWIKAHTVEDYQVSGLRSLQTAEEREAFVKEHLENEWAALGTGPQGRSAETAIEMEDEMEETA